MNKALLDHLEAEVALLERQIANVRKLLAALRAPTGRRGCNRTPIKADDRYGRLVAVEDRGIDRGGNVIWLFRCRCGELVRARVSNVRANVRSLGWASCRSCYFDAGGIEGIKRMRESAAGET